MTTIKQLLRNGKTAEEIIEMGYRPDSVRRAVKHLNDPGRTVPTEDVVLRPLNLGFDDASSTNYQYQLLASTVIVKAVNELSANYIRVKISKKKQARKDAEREIKSLEKFMRERASYFTSIEPEILLKASREKADRYLSGDPEERKKKTYQWLPHDSYTSKIDHRRKEYKNG